MTRTVTALFDTRDHAESAQRRLNDAGVTDIKLTTQDAMAGGSASTSDGLKGSSDPVRDVSEGDYGERGERGHQGGGGFWQSLKNLFSDEDRPTYEEGLRRGHVLLTAHVDDERTDEAIRVLEDSDAIDVDERAEQWRSSGWSAAPAHDPSVAGHVGDDRVTGHHGDDALKGPSTDDEARLGEDDRLAASAGQTEERIPIVQEQLRVGKREVDRGGVRVRSYVSEQPVHEQVSLRDEHVSIERRPVDQPLSAATDADLFRERSFEVTEHDEEAVVGKEARVVEELVVRKEIEDRTQTIDDTVRRTEVDVDDQRGAGLTGEPRAFSAADSMGEPNTTDDGLGTTPATNPNETEEERRLRMARYGGGATITPSI